MPTLNPLVLDTGSPPIPEVQAWGRAYGGGRGPLIDLCQAVPGYPPHPALLEHLAAEAGAPAAAALLALGALLALLGVLVERWLMFAEATHTAMLYYR